MHKTLNVLLVNPPPIAIVEPWFDQADWARDSLAYLAAYLRQHEGFEIRIIDAKFQRMNFDDVMSEAKSFRPDVVAFCALTNEIKPAAYLAARVKEEIPGAVTVVGGAHITAVPIATLNTFPMIDIGVIGEGEVSFYELCQALREGSGIRDIPGLCYRDDGQVVRSVERERILDQDSIPDPAFDLLPPAREYWVQTVRGCPFHCNFCMNHNGRVPRKRSVSRVVAQIENLIERYHPEYIRFGDEIFTVDMERTHQMMDEFIRRGISKQIKWDCQTHVRFVDRELLQKMKDAGCVRVDMGIESGDKEKLRTLGKGTNLAMIEKAFDAAREVGIPFGTLLIIGHPNDTIESIHQTLDMAVRFNPDTPFISVMIPFPGTEVSKMAAAGENGYRLVSTDWDDYSAKVGSALEFAGLTRNQIVRLQIWGYIRVFLYNYRFKDLAKFIWQYRKAGMQVVMSAFRKSPTRYSPHRPADYDERLKTGRATTPEEIIRGRIEWEEYQKVEVKRSRKFVSDPLQIVSVE